MPDKEFWVPIHDYPDYEVSNLGRVRSLKINCGNIIDSRKILKPFLTRHGYFCVSLCKNGKPKKYLSHRLVANAFVPNPQQKPYVNHINGIKTDNRADNLEFVTARENVQHAYNFILPSKGIKHPKAKLTDEQVKQIRDEYICYDRKYGAEPLSRKFNVSPRAISNIVAYKTYKNVK